MKFLTLSTIMVLFAVFYVSTPVQAEDEKLGYLQITESLVNVYEQLDPRSPIIRQAKKGEYLELKYVGATWHKVAIDGKIGWIERKAGKIVQNAGGVPVAGIIILIVVLIGTLGGAVYFIKKNQSPAAVGANDDL